MARFGQNQKLLPFRTELCEIDYSIRCKLQFAAVEQRKNQIMRKLKNKSSGSGSGYGHGDTITLRKIKLP